jgi:outer membrane protein W
MTRHRPWHLVAAVVVAGMLAAAPPARAQRSGDGFLFRAPSGSFVLRAGLADPSARSDIFGFVTNELTLRKSDFRGLALSGELQARVGDRLDLVFGAAWSGSRHRSEYRNFVDNNNLPIEQTTSFERLPVTVGVRYFLVPPGQSVGHLAWVPNRYAPYLGAGVGVMWYQFRQTGDFIDMNTMNVFADSYRSADWTITAHVNAGVDVSVSPRTFVTAEARYSWARASLGSDFVGFDRIDLSGLTLSLGVGFRM